MGQEIEQLQFSNPKLKEVLPLKSFYPQFSPLR